MSGACGAYGAGEGVHRVLVGRPKGKMGSRGVWLSRTGIVELLGSDIDGSLRGL